MQDRRVYKLGQAEEEISNKPLPPTWRTRLLTPSPGPYGPQTSVNASCHNVIPMLHTSEGRPNLNLLSPSVSSFSGALHDNVKQQHVCECVHNPGLPKNLTPWPIILFFITRCDTISLGSQGQPKKRDLLVDQRANSLQGGDPGFMGTNVLGATEV